MEIVGEGTEWWDSTIVLVVAAEDLQFVQKLSDCTRGHGNNP